MAGRGPARLQRAPSASAELRRVAEKVAASFGATAVAAVHRVGDLAVGDLAVVVAVSCPHRGDAFEACRALIDELKASVPIWKHQQFVGGEASGSTARSLSPCPAEPRRCWWQQPES